MRILPLALAAACLAASTQPAAGQVLDTVRVASGLTKPLYVTAPANDGNRVFILEQNGKIKILKSGSVLPTPYIDLGSTGLNKVSTNANERGLLGLAFHPDYATNGHFFVNYTNLSGATVVERYTVSAGNPDVADTSTGTIFVGPIAQPFSNHNGGCIAFGMDGKLYVGMGDGGSGNDPGNRAQNPLNLLGKILRYDVDLPAPHIPADNPFVGDGSTLDEIWSLGWRNPWRLSFDRTTGDMYVGDVGQFVREEIDIEPAGMGGLNYGWRCMEGFNCTGLSGCTCNAPALTLPVHDYNHAGGRCSVTGGFVYNGCELSSSLASGTYFFADYCSAQVWTFDWDGSSMNNFTERTADLAPGGGLSIALISSFGEDANGELYICDWADGELYRIVPEGAGGGGPADCNANGISDACDIAAGTSFDTNGNDVPDECECPTPAFTYCTSQVNSLGCTPAMTFTGSPKVGQVFLVQAVEIVNQKNGLFFYGFAANNSPFLGGTLCVQQPFKRTPVQNSGGSAVGADCTGSFSYDFGARITSGVDPALVVGQQVNGQYWSRDPLSFTSDTNLTDGIEFVICN